MIESTGTQLHRRHEIDDSMFFLSIKLGRILLDHNALCLERSIDGPESAKIK